MVQTCRKLFSEEINCSSYRTLNLRILVVGHWRFVIISLLLMNTNNGDNDDADDDDDDDDYVDSTR